ncbi:hypothetical protein [Undibacterium crateris]|uniref:hypothetical protein n=1 Tax=Undibacterium crateris TaxID=2528175 RepID=UPI00138986F6|nr:hypothetical protein [Undibacterium crateris]NDI84254.1 hypothetical protein [Undibacterium crateris]
MAEAEARAEPAELAESLMWRGLAPYSGLTAAPRLGLVDLPWPASVACSVLACASTAGFGKSAASSALSS